MREAVERVELSEPVGRYLVDVVRATRSLAGVEVGASPRGALALLLSTRARAALLGRDFVLPDDVKALASCLSRPSADTLAPIFGCGVADPRTSSHNASIRCLCLSPTISEPARCHSQSRRVRDARPLSDCWLPSSSATRPSSLSPRRSASPSRSASWLPSPRCQRFGSAPTDLRLVENDKVTIALELSSPEAIPRCDVTLDVPVGLGSEGPTAWSLRLHPDTPVVIEVPVTADNYGRFSIGPARIHVPGLFGILDRSGVDGNTVGLEVRPRAEALRTLVRAREVRATAGDRLARRPGDGIEFAEVRPYSAGAPGRLNWRVTARHGEPYVNLRHPERSTDLILLVDTFSAALLPRQVRAASGLAAAYLARHDRVGLVAFGGILHWVEPAMGRAQLERLLAALTATHWHHSYAWKSAETIPSRALPSTGLVVAISPLEDHRMLNALATIRARGVDLAIIETIGRGPVRPKSTAGDLAARLIELERVGMRDNFAASRCAGGRMARRRVARGTAAGARHLATPRTRARGEMRRSGPPASAGRGGPFRVGDLGFDRLGDCARDCCLCAERRPGRHCRNRHL